jgi:hypothetical protein
MEFTFELGRSVEMTFDLGGSAPQPTPEPSGGCFIAGNVLVTTSGIVAAAPYIAGIAETEE